jgi:hypothetical protein
MKVYLVKSTDLSVPATQVIKGFLLREKAVSFMKKEAEDSATDCGEEITEERSNYIKGGHYPDHHEFEVEEIDVE